MVENSKKQTLTFVVSRYETTMEEGGWGGVEVSINLFRTFIFAFFAISSLPILALSPSDSAIAVTGARVNPVNSIIYIRFHNIIGKNKKRQGTMEAHIYVANTSEAIFHQKGPCKRLCCYYSPHSLFAVRPAFL